MYEFAVIDMVSEIAEDTLVTSKKRTRRAPEMAEVYRYA
jgi:hypothetical protein